MNKKRIKKETDKYNTEFAYKLLNDVVGKNPEIEPSLWIGALWSILVYAYLNSEISYENFSFDFESAKNHYKGRWG